MRCVDHGGVQHEHGGQNISQQARPIFWYDLLLIIYYL
jgi:hypothetical protein